MSQGTKQFQHKNASDFKIITCNRYFVLEFKYSGYYSYSFRTCVLSEVGRLYDRKGNLFSIFGGGALQSAVN